MTQLNGGMNATYLRALSPHIAQYCINDIALLAINNAHCSAWLSLQGAQLLSWQPNTTAHDVFWLSEIEPFQLGRAIRGGIPLCYPWFGARTDAQAHGFARNVLWSVGEIHETSEYSEIRLLLHEQQKNIAEMVMRLGATCRLQFRNQSNAAAQCAFHTYYRISNLTEIEIAGAMNPQPAQAVRHLPNGNIKIAGAVDGIQRLTTNQHQICDPQWGRVIDIRHHNASDMVLWNPWTQPVSSMQAQDYRQFICLETARILQPLQPNESMGVQIAIVPEQ